MNHNELRKAVDDFVATRGGSPRRVRDLYAVRQLLVRMQATEHADRFRLKGGMYVGAVLGDYLRTTRDADVLSPGHADPEEIRGVFEVAIAVDLADHVVYSKIEATRAERKVHGYDGVAVTVDARVAGLPASASFDIGYGDAVVPEGGRITIPPMFDGGPLVMPAYSVEAFLAEKTETVISGFPGSTLKRLKDFYDISELTRLWPDPLEGPILCGSFEATFGRRKTDRNPEAFRDIRGYVESEADRMQREWDDFKQRAGVRDPSRGLVEAIDETASFSGAVLAALHENRPLEADWRPGQGWVPR